MTELSECIKVLKSLSRVLNYVCSNCLVSTTYYKDLWCKYVCSEVQLVISNISLGHYVDALRGLKAVMEGSIQSLYYFTRYGLEEGAIAVEAKRRQRSATSFNIKMLGKIRGLHAKTKKDILKLYLKIAEFSHPTSKVIKLSMKSREEVAREVIKEVINDVCDYAAYSAVRLCGKEVVHPELIDELLARGFRRATKYLRS